LIAERGVLKAELGEREATSFKLNRICGKFVIAGG
jgi:hypothetical protein